MTDNPRIRQAYAAAAGRDGGQTAFLQALETLYESLEPVLEEQPGWAGLLERLGEPERTVIFPVIWTDGRGRARQGRGFFIQYSTALGPWQGGLCFRQGLDLSAAKALALASALEYALAGLPAGGGLAGADADVRAMSDGESRRFCRGFMEGLYPLLPCPFDPGLWRGQLPGREAACLTGAFQRMDALTGRTAAPAAPGGLMSRAQATGWGLCILASLALRRHTGVRLEGQRVLVAGHDGTAGWAGERAARMGARIVALGDGGGCLYAAEGLPLATLRAIAEQPELPLLLWAIRAPGVEYRPGPGLWDIPADAAFLCGGRLDGAGARRLLENGCTGIFEAVPGAASGTAARLLAESGALYAPAIAAGAGGAVMERLGDPSLTSWAADRLLRGAMGDILQTVWDESLRCGCPGQLLRAAHIAAFRPLAAAVARRDG